MQNQSQNQQYEEQSVFYNENEQFVYYNNKLYKISQNSENINNLQRESTRFLSTETETTTTSATTSEHIAGEKEKNTQEAEQEGSVLLSIFFLIASFLLCLSAGVFSGLTVGYLSISDLDLDITIKTGSKKDQESAKTIKEILKEHHLLLSTLLIANAIALETLPICLEKSMGRTATIICSTFLVVLFSEIIPQSICTGPQKLQIAEKMAPIIKLLNCIFYIFSRPLGMFLDNWIGTHQKTRFPRKDLKALIELHQSQKEDEHESSTQAIELQDKSHHGQGSSSVGNGGNNTNDNADESHGHGLHEQIGLTKEESKLMISTIELRDRTVENAMIPIQNVFMVNENDKITKEFIKSIMEKGYSQIPVFKNNKNNVIGVVKAKNLIRDEKSIKFQNKPMREQFSLQDPLLVSKDTSLLDMLMIFQDKQASIALITKEVRKQNFSQNSFFSKQEMIVAPKNQNANIELIGLIALKDIFEEILKKELQDDDVHQTDFKQKMAQQNEQNREYSSLHKDDQQLYKSGSEQPRNQFNFQQSIDNQRKRSSKDLNVNEENDESEAHIERSRTKQLSAKENKEILAKKLKLKVTKQQQTEDINYIKNKKSQY